MGPVVGVVGAYQAALALRVLDEGELAYGKLMVFDGKSESLRERTVRPRASCPLCGPVPRIHDLEMSRYLGGVCKSEVDCAL